MKIFSNIESIQKEQTFIVQEKELNEIFELKRFGCLIGARRKYLWFRGSLLSPPIPLVLLQPPPPPPLLLSPIVIELRGILLKFA